MSETTGTPTTPTEGNTSTETSTAAAGTTLLGTEGATTSTTTQETGKPAEGEQQAAKPAETTETTKEGETKGDAKPEGAPEKYEFTAPEGVTYDPSVIEAFSKGAKEANLSQDAAQKLLSEMVPALKAREAEQVKAVQNGWAEETKADKEIGGDKLASTLVLAKKGYETFATPALKELMEVTGLGNHPEVIRAFSRIGKSLSEDTFVKGTSPGSGPVDWGSTMYPNTPKQGA